MSEGIPGHNGGVVLGGQGNKSHKDKELPPTVSELFTPQEEAFLRHYSEGKVRLEAMVAAGFVDHPPGVQEQQGLMAQAGALIARAEQMSLSQVSSAIGADKILFCALLWEWCKCDRGNEALKALMLMGRIHGLWDKSQAQNTQVALIFNQAQAPAASMKPVDLPFNLSSADYRPFPQPDNENEARKP